MMSTDKLLKQLQKNYLTELNLSYKTLTLERAEALVAAISHPSCKLKTLDLSHCVMAKTERDEILILLAKGLQRNESLGEVDLTLNFDFSREVTDALVQTLRLNRSLISFRINVININDKKLQCVIRSELQTNDMLHEKDMHYSPEFFSKKSPPTTPKTTSNQPHAKDIKQSLQHAA